MDLDRTEFSLVADSSAIVSIELREPGYLGLVDKLAESPAPCIGAPTLFEASMVLQSRSGEDPRNAIFRILKDADMAVVPFDEECYQIALAAFQRFGKGRHPASLNFGDCLAYAMAINENAPLLFVGDDFAKTDIQSA